MTNSRTRDMDITFFENVFSMMAYGQPDDFHNQILEITREHNPRRIEVGFGPLSEGYSPIGTIEVGPFTASEILMAREKGLLEKVNKKVFEQEESDVWKYMQQKEPPTSIRIDMSDGEIIPFAIELKIEKYFDVSRNYEEVNPAVESLDDLQLEREAVMIWHVMDFTKPGVFLAPLRDYRI